MKGREALTALDPPGLEILEVDQQEFAARLAMRNHTLKRALTDPRLFSGIGNAYSDEILHHAKLSPIAQTQKLIPAEIGRLYDSVRTVLQEWSARLIEQAGDDFPTKVTAFTQRWWFTVAMEIYAANAVPRSNGSAMHRTSLTTVRDAKQAGVF